MSLDSLTDKQYQFTLNYIKHGYNAYQAAIASGYSEKYARVQAPGLINHPPIFERIAKAHQALELKRMEELTITISDKAHMLMRIINDVMPQEGEIKRQYYKSALQAIDMLNKMSGHYAPTKSLSVNVETTRAKIKEAKRIYNEY